MAVTCEAKAPAQNLYCPIALSLSLSLVKRELGLSWLPIVHTATLMSKLIMRLFPLLSLYMLHDFAHINSGDAKPGAIVARSLDGFHTNCLLHARTQTQMQRTVLGVRTDRAIPTSSSTRI
jgi:hypothetical protein